MFLSSSLPAASGLSSPCGLNLLNLKIGALRCSETSVPFYQSTLHVTSEDFKFYQVSWEPQILHNLFYFLDVWSRKVPGSAEIKKKA
jgi:hypothetical protein